MYGSRRPNNNASASSSSSANTGSGGGGYVSSAPRSSTRAVTQRDVLGGLTLKSVFLRLGISKPEPADLSTEQHQALTRLEAAQNRLDETEQQIKRRMATTLQTNPKAALTRERAELQQLKLDRAKNDEYIKAIVTQRSHIERRRNDAQVLGVLSRGNVELKRETQAAQDAHDISDITGDFDDLINEGVEDQVDILEGFANVDTTSRLEDVTIQTTNGPMSMGSEIDQEIEEMRRQALAESEFQALEVREALPNVERHHVDAKAASPLPHSSPSSSPMMSGRMPVPLADPNFSPVRISTSRVPVPNGNHRPHYSPSSPLLNTSTPQTTLSPLAANAARATSNNSLTFEEDLDWLQ
jgi:hypothetical protein